MLNMYSAVIKAKNQGCRLSAPMILLAKSEWEAEQMGIERAHYKWPKSEGWKKHHVELLEVPDEMLITISDKVLSLLNKEK